MAKVSVNELLGGGMNSSKEVGEPIQATEKTAKPELDLAAVMKKGFELFGEQAQLGTHPQFQDLEGIALSEAKASAFLNAINNALNVSHLANLAQASDVQFQRTKEMEVYNPILNSFAVASNVMDRKIGYFARQLHYSMERLEQYEREGIRLDYLGSVNPQQVCNVQTVGGGGNGGGVKKKPVGGQNWFENDEGDFELGEDVSEGVEVEQVRQFEPGKSPAELLMHIDGLQYIFDKSTQNMAQLTTSMDTLVKSERYSGSRPWGSTRAGIPTVIQPMLGGGRGSLKSIAATPTEPRVLTGGTGGGHGEGKGNGAIREMTLSEIGELLLKQQQEAGLREIASLHKTPGEEG